MVQLSLFLVSLVLTAFAALVWRAPAAGPSNRWFAAFTLSAAGWAISIGAAYVLDYAALTVRLAFASASLTPPTLLGFARHFPTLDARWPPALYRLALGTGLALAAVSISTELVVAEARLTPDGLSRKPGVLYPLFVSCFLATFATAAALLVRRWRQAHGAIRDQLRYLAIGILVPGAGAITTNLVLPAVTGSSRHGWIGPYFGLLVVGVVTHVIVRYRPVNLRLAVGRGLRLAVASLASLAPVALVLAALWDRLAARLEPAETALILAAVGAASLATPVIRQGTEALLDRYLYRSRADFRTSVLEASRLLTRGSGLDMLASQLRLADVSIGAEGLAVYLRADGEFRAVEAVPAAAPVNGRFTRPEILPDEVLRMLMDRRGLLRADDLLQGVSAGLARTGALHELGWAVVLPIRFEDQVLGAIAVGPKLSGEPFHPQDLDLLVTLANQAGIAVRNAQLHAQAVLASKHIDGIVSTIESGVVAVDAAGRVTMFSRRAEQLTGVSRDGVLGRAAGALPPPLAELLSATLADGQAHTRGDATLTDGTTTRPVTCTTSPLRGPGGDPLGAVAVLSDLTPLKSLEAERRRAERLARLQVLAPRLAHEIKNPLVAIKTFAQLLGRRRDQAFVDHFNRIVTREIERMERLLGRLRTLSQAGDGPRAPMDVRGPIREALEFLQPSFEGRSVTVRASLGSEPRIVVGDPGEMEELFLNLLTNALEATPPHGLVSVDVAVDQAGVTVSVADTGPGIPEALLERIFDPFVTTKRGGTGIGLTICAGIAAAHRAKLRAANRPAGGAIFTLELPLADPDSART